MRLRDLVIEAVTTIAARPVRSVLTAMGTTAGVGTLVVTVGLTATVQGQVSERFDRFASTEVVVESQGLAQSAEEVPLGTDAFPSDYGRRLDRLPGVIGSGLFWQVDTRGRSFRTQWHEGESPNGLDLFAASDSALSVIELEEVVGRSFKDIGDATRQPVMLLSEAAAQTLGLTDIRRAPQVFIGDLAFTVVGIFGDVRRRPETLLAGIIPTATADQLFPGQVSGPARLLIETEAGAAQVIARQAAVALRPDQERVLRAVSPPDPRTLRREVQDDLSTLFVAVALVSLMLGGFGIANTTLVAVLERVPEIGLRRALGAKRRHVAAQFLLESTALGTLGGVVGTSLGLLVVAVMALANDWTAVVDPLVVMPSPLLGAVTGLLAGAYPSLRATRIEPTEAMRRT